MKPMTRQRWMLAAVAAGVGLLVADNWPRGPAAPAATSATSATPAPSATKSLAEIVVAPVRAAPSAATSTADDRLDTALIAARSAALPSGDDAFAPKSWVRPPPPPPPPVQVAAPPPPPPQAPPLPFKLLGRLDETPEKTVWYLGDGERLLLASPGDTIDGAWRLEGLEAGQLRFTYLPLSLQQRLTIGAPP